MNNPDAKNPLSYLGVTAPQPPNWVRGTAAPASTLKFPTPTIYFDDTSDAVYASQGDGVWVTLGIGSSGDVVAVNGTANQITASTAAGVVTLSLPAAITAPGSLTTTTSLAATTTVTAGTGVTATTGNITATAGNVAAGAAVTATTTVTAGTGITATTGNIQASGGDIITTRSSAGADVTLEATNSDNTDGASRAGVEIATGGASSGDPYLSFQISGVAASTMTMGLDNSASDLFVISNSTAIGTSNALTLSQAGALGATTTITAGTDIISTAGNIEIQGAAKQLRVEGGAVTDFIGQATLVAGTVTVANTNIAATDRIFVTRSDVSTSTALGVFDVTITPATSFTIDSRNPTDATVQTNDVSVVDYFIVRQL